jgi:hypothetical protein
MSTILQQIIDTHGTAAARMPHEVAAYYLCHRCAGDARTLRNMRDEIIPAFLRPEMFLPHEVAEAIAVFESRFPQQVAA